MITAEPDTAVRTVTDDALARAAAWVAALTGPEAERATSSTADRPEPEPAAAG